MTLPRRCAHLILLVTLIACTERTPPPADAPASSAPDAVPSEAGAPTDTTSAAPAVDTSVALALDGEGLRVIRVATGSTRLVAFGEERAVVIDATRRLLGGSSPVMTDNLDCPATVATWPANKLQLWFAADAAARFIGWSLGGGAPADPAPKLTTMSGIGLGSTRAAMESVYVAKVARSSLGIEFSAGGLAGLLASAQPGARIENLWAGQVCLAR